MNYITATVEPAIAAPTFSELLIDHYGSGNLCQEPSF